MCFRDFVLQNFPYLEDDFDALTDYELFCKMVEYMKKTLEDVETFIDGTNEELASFREQLETYEKYFENLDVQEEINNKLDEMTQDGTLTNLIKAYVDPIYQTYESSINARVDQINAKVDSATSGSPLVASSTDEMTDTERVYVNTTDGKWYYYDGDSWEIGGTYQSTGIGINTVTVESFADDVDGIINLSTPEYTEITGYYVGGATGNPNASVQYNIRKISVNKGQTIKINAKAGNTIALLSFYNDMTEKYLPLILGTDGSNNADYYYTATTTGTYAISYAISGNYAVSTYLKEKTILDILNSYRGYGEFVNPTITNGYYIGGATGNKTSQASHSLVDVGVVSAGKTIHVETYVGTAVGVIAKVNSDNTYTPLVTGSNENASVTYEYTLPVDTHIILSIRNNKMYDYFYYTKVSNIYDNVMNYLKDDKQNIFNMFTNITCIGDSLTKCVVYTGANTARTAYKTWPQLLGIKTGAIIDNVSEGGYSVADWWSHFENNITQKDNQLFIIYLGSNGGMTDTVDTDCAGDDPTEYANNNTGDYGRIIAKCLSVGGKVLLVKIHALTYKVDTNNAIDDFATKFNVACVDNDRLLDKIYHYYPDLTGYNDLHYNDLGYSQFLNQLLYNTSNLSDEMIKRLFPE